MTVLKQNLDLDGFHETRSLAKFPWGSLLFQERQRKAIEGDDDNTTEKYKEIKDNLRRCEKKYYNI